MASERTQLEVAPGTWLTSSDGWGQRRRIAQQRAIAKSNSRIAWYPIIFFQTYLAFTVLLFAFGPWPWPVSNPLKLYAFLILAQAALFAGYRSAIKKQPRSSRIVLPVRLIVVVSLAFNYAWISENYKLRTGSTFNTDSAIAAVDTGLKDPGVQYDDRQKRYENLEQAQSRFMSYTTLLLYPVLWLAFPLGVFFWSRLSLWVRLALVGFIILDLSTWVAAGTNKGIADFVMLLPCILVARNPATLTRTNLRNVIMLGLITIIGLTALFAFFSLGLLSRSQGNVVPLYNNSIGISADPDSLSLRFLPPEIQGQAAAFASYLTQGYYGLSLALDQPFVFCDGVGNSYFLEGLTRNFRTVQIIEYTYPARIEGSGWDRYANWHSIYPWIASDISFPGTIVFMFLIGRLFALVWLDVAFCKNPWAVSLLAVLLIMLFYVPANNQVLGFATAAMPFFVLLPVWLYSRMGGRRADREVAPA